MQETTEQRPATPAIDDLVVAAQRAADWAGEPFLHNGEQPADVLAPGTARRNALDEASAEIEAGREEPSSPWKVRFALMLGLERILSERPTKLASGTELLAANQRVDEPVNGNGLPGPAEAEDEEDEYEELVDEVLEAEEPAPAQDPGAVRRYRFRHPTASGKTIAAAGFVEAARTMGVLILTHRRLLV